MYLMSEALVGYLRPGDWELADPRREEDMLMTGHEQANRLQDTIDEVLARTGRVAVLGAPYQAEIGEPETVLQQDVSAEPPFENADQARHAGEAIAAEWEALCDDFDTPELHPINPYGDRFIPRSE